MTDMGFLGKLLDGETVAWKPLSDVIISLKTGLNPRKNFQLNTMDAEGYYVTVREIQNGNIVFLDKTDRVSTKVLKLINNRSNLEVGDILFSGTGTVGRIAVVKLEPKSWNIKEGIYAIKPIHEVIDSRYLSHILNSQKITNEYSKKIVGSPVVSLPMGDLKKLTIPIPCPENPKKSLEIQADIVRILDKFTELNAELTTELTFRKKQYKHYRNQLLTFKDEDVKWKTLGDVCRFINGRAYKQTELLASGKYPVLRVGNFFTNSNWYHSDLELDEDKYCVNGDLLYAWSASFGPRIWDGEKVIYHYHIWKIVPDANIISKKYLYYLLAWDTAAIKEAHGTGSTMMHIGKGSIEKRLVPIPSLPEQARIVAILDKFEILTTSINDGLPREIALRHKQFEHYRELLLSFPKPAERAA